MHGKPNTPELIWSRFNKTDTCWLWTGPTNGTGYGMVRWQGKNMLTHRLAYLLTHGHLPTGVHICHRCDVTLCGNPDHLFAGDRSINMVDSVMKGRHSRVRLSAEDVIAIRARAEVGESKQSLAVAFGIHEATANNIIKRRIWRHV